MELSEKWWTCTITADWAETRMPTALGRPAPGDFAFRGNVVISIARPRPNSPALCVLHLDDITSAIEAGRLFSSGPVRCVFGDTELKARGLELHCSPILDQPEGARINAIDGVDLCITPTSSLIVTLGNRDTDPDARTEGATGPGTGHIEKSLPAEQVIAARREYVKSDPMVSELLKKIAEVEIDLISARQNLLPENREIIQKKQLLEALNRRLEERRKELLEEFDTGFAERLASPPVVSAMTQTSATSDAEETRIVMDLAVLNVSDDRALSPETAARLSSLWDQMYAKRKTERDERASLPSAEELQVTPRQLLERCAENAQGDSDALEIMVDLLASLEYVRIVCNPRLEVRNGQQAQIESKQHVPDPTAEPGTAEMVECRDIVEVTPHADSAGRITLDVTADITDLIPSNSTGKTPRISKHRIDTKAVLDKDKTLVLRLEPTTESDSQDDPVLHLLVRPRIVSPESTATDTSHGHLRRNGVSG
jgi:hypothetical protein